MNNRLKVFLRKASSYIRNRYYSRSVMAELIKKAPQKLIEPEAFFRYLNNKDYAGSQVPVITVFKAGFAFKCLPKDIGVLGETCILEDYQKIPGLEIRPGDTVFDVGAHVGSFSVYAASKGAKVYALEPDVNNFAGLLENIKLNNFESRIVPINKVLHFRSGEVGFSPNSLNSGGGNISDNILPNQVKVQAITLAGLLELSNLSQVDLLKIDIEGAEYEIFEHLKPGEFGGIKKIVGEYHLDWRNNKNFSYLKKLLKPHFKTVESYPPYNFYALR